jgi:hypothetical protein
MTASVYMYLSCLALLCDEVVAADGDMGVARQTDGGSCLTLSIVLYTRLLGGELGMMPVRVCVRVRCSYSQTTPPWWSLATS